MPTLYSLTNDFLTETEKLDDFLKGTEKLKKQLAEVKVEPYIIKAIDKLQDALISSKAEKESSNIREKINKLLIDEHFKRGSRVIELPKDISIKEELEAKNVDDMLFFNQLKENLKNLKRYTIDSIKEYVKIVDAEKNIVEESKKVRVIEAIFNAKDFKGNMDTLTQSDLLEPKNWIEEEREEKEERAVVEHIKTINELNELFPVENLLITEGRVILGNKNYARDITELVRQTMKESYKELMNEEGKAKRIRRGKK